VAGCCVQSNEPLSFINTNNFLVDEQLLTSEEQLSSMELIIKYS
jgi:hypothetical protein